MKRVTASEDTEPECESSKAYWSHVGQTDPRPHLCGALALYARTQLHPASRYL